MPISKPILAVVTVAFATLSGIPAKGGSISRNGAAVSWWVNSQAGSNWSAAHPYAAARLNYAGTPSSAWNLPAANVAVATPVASPAPVVTASAPAVSSPLIAVPYGSSNQTAYTAPATTYTAPAATYSTPSVSSADTRMAAVSTYVQPTTAPVTLAPVSMHTTPAVDGFINLGTGPYPADASITTGNSQPWFSTSLVNNFFGGHPTAQQQADFTSAVLHDVQKTFSDSGVNVSLTTDPNVAANHTLSVVSNSAAALLPSAIGMTQVGGNGFSFMDQEAKSVQSLPQLEKLVAHNVSHELMLAFGVPENYDHTGNYIDAPNASFAMMTGDSATFSKAAADALNKALQGTSLDSSQTLYAQVITPEPVPEPAGIALWISATVFLGARYRNRVRNRA